MNAFAEFIGYVAIFAIGLAACFYGGLIGTATFRDNHVTGSDGLSDLAIGFVVGCALSIIYIVGWVIWLAVT